MLLQANTAGMEPSHFRHDGLAIEHNIANANLQSTPLATEVSNAARVTGLVTASKGRKSIVPVIKTVIPSIIGST